eukprot:scaffold1208_cov231-Pinguiococcus_pyrenoidosus.AAC.2
MASDSLTSAAQASLESASGSSTEPCSDRESVKASASSAKACAKAAFPPFPFFPRTLPFNARASSSAAASLAACSARSS